MSWTSASIDALTFARWQFAITTVYHFVLVPLTIGMSLLVAIMQTMWHKTGKEHWLQATRFFGKLLLINFALGISTGIVQEFQFGMNWSEYSLFVGDIFGAPLAVEALLAFFMESTFLGLWIFGWGRLSKGMHLACIWLTAIGTMLSAIWILGANSWMQHPVGAIFNPETGRAELDGVAGFFEVVKNPALLWEFTHVITSAWLTAGAFVAGLAIWWMTRAARKGGEEGEHEARNIWRPIAQFGLIAVIVGGLGVVATGHFQAQEMMRLQPIKMSVAEGVCVDTKGAAFTVAQFGDCPLDGSSTPTKFIQVPGLSSFLAENNFSAESQGVSNANDRMKALLNSNESFVAKYGDANAMDYVPPQMATFWTFRAMIGFGVFSVILALWALWAMRGGRVPTSKALGSYALWSIGAPFLAISFGWIFTEVGRQPWVVVPDLSSMASGDPTSAVLMLTAAGVSTAVPAYQVALTMILFTVLYGALGVVWFILLRRYALEGIHRKKEKITAEGTANTDKPSDDSVGALSFGY